MPSLWRGQRQQEPPPGPPPEPPAVTALPKTVVVRIEYPNGAVREFTCHNPLGFQQVVAGSGEMAHLPPGFPVDAKEPVVAVMFSGNPAAGGIQVRASGKL